MYDKFKNQDLDLLKIQANAVKFGVEFGQNIEILKMLFEKKDLDLKAEFAAVVEIFEALKQVKLNSQMSS